MAATAKKILEHFALLAPVPLEHLRSALGVLATKPEVSFGSNNFERFRDLDAMRGTSKVPVMIYASHEGEVKHNFEVSWFGWYRRKDEPPGGVPRERDLRPPTTEGERWATYWYVDSVCELPKSVSVAKISKLSGGKFKAAPVRGPIIVPLLEPLTSAVLLSAGGAHG